ncbi:MAG TPA: alpha/beta hydrolase [Spirochaetota bacterium]|nr:alpha/beta hydrolase [Spirochaetota bacterium]
MKRTSLIIAIVMLLLPAAVFAGGSSSNTCNTRYPVVLSHGMGAQYEIAWGITHYWNRIPDALEDEGARVYITSVNSMDGTVSKANQWRRQVLEILATSGASRVNVIGHSHGSIYTRYAMSNLGMGRYVASHTSIAGPHRGSSIAEVVLGVIEGNIGEDILNGLFSFLMGDTNPDTAQNLRDLSRSYMVNVFNPAVPNVGGVYYQSYAYQIKTAIGAGMFLVTWLIQLGKEGANDGLVAVNSAKWGNFRGVTSGSWWAGVNHLMCVDMLFGITPGFDAVGHFEGIVRDLKNRGF